MIYIYIIINLLAKRLPVLNELIAQGEVLQPVGQRHVLQALLET